MAPSISWPSSGVLTAGLAWSLDSDLFTQWLGISGGAILHSEGGASSVHGQDAGAANGNEVAEMDAVAEMQVPAEVVVPDVVEPAALDEAVAVDLVLEVVAKHDPDAEPAYEATETAVLEECDESVMVWPSADQSEDEDEVCSSSLKRRRLE